jgi:oligopeptide/dipeptide ABC transporter ATP-binding protein
MSLVAVDGVSQWFRGQTTPAVNKVSLAVEPGELVALVGESGCGKSTLGRVVCGLQPPTDGSVVFQGHNVDQLSGKEKKAFHRRVQMVHQDPFASLNPSLPLRTTLGYGPRYHKLVGKRDLDTFLIDLLKSVGLDESSDFLDRYPHQLSGGQRQRVSIARALSLDPLLIVADEAVSMLDVSMRVSLLDLMLRLRDEKGIGYLFVSHDLGVVRYFAGEGRMVVMFYGIVVEEGNTEDVITEPHHPYTSLLLEGIPIPDPRRARQRHRGDLLEQASASPSSVGCVFRHRCPLAQDRCAQEQPPLLEVNGGHRSACWFHEQVPERAALVTGG